LEEAPGERHWPALAVNLGHDVSLYARDEKAVKEINSSYRNTCYLPDIVLPEMIREATDPRQALNSADLVMAVIPAQALAVVLGAVAPFVPVGIPLVLCSKGIERTSGRFMSDIAADIKIFEKIALFSQFALLSGLHEHFCKG